MKVRTASEVNDTLAEELIWRKKELTSLKFLIEGSRTHPDRSSALLRSGIALLYAHWEGFVKAASRVYLEFLQFKKLQYDQLSHNFVAIAARNRVRAASESGKIAPYIELVRFFRTELGTRSNFPPREGLSTDSNLSSRVLRDIVDGLGLDYEPFSSKAVLIDERLVDARNNIAHGEYLQVSFDDFAELHVEVIAMIELFRNQVDNAVSTKMFLSVQK